MNKTYAMIALCGAAVAAIAPAASGQLTEDLKLTASDAAASDNFGNSVSISGTTAIIGANKNDDGGTDSGSAYLFDTTTGQQLFKLTASDAEPGDGFGKSVAISGSTAIVGVPLEGSLFSEFGSAYLFDTTTGQQLFKINASDAAADDEFGFSVAISGTTAIVGARLEDGPGGFFTFNSGSAYLFDTTTGQQLFKLRASDAGRDDELGFSVAISGTIAIVGARFDDDGGISSGSAYLFDVATGQQLFKLTASDAAVGDRFGQSVSISGTTAIVGAPRDDDAGGGSGSAYIFDTSTGQQLFKLTASDAQASDEFGLSVSISGTTAVVGARFNDDAGSNSGSAYLFDTTTGQQLFKLAASDPATEDQFGVSVAISGTTTIATARLDDDGSTDSGSAYVFDTSPPPPCVGDIADDFGTLGGDGQVSFGDFLALLGLVGPCP